MTDLYNLYYNKDMKNAIATERKDYYNRVFKKACYYVAITTKEAVITYYFDKATNKITHREHIVVEA